MVDWKAMTPKERTDWIAEELVEYHHWNRVVAESWQRRIEQLVIDAMEMVTCPKCGVKVELKDTNKK